MNDIGLHYINTKRNIKRKAKKMAKKMARKYLHDELEKKGYIIRQRPESTFQKIMNKAIFFIAIIWPVLTLPQIRSVWVNKQVEWVSVYTWWAYTFTNICWLAYAIINREKTLIFNYILRFTVNLAVFLGIVIHR